MAKIIPQLGPPEDMLKFDKHVLEGIASRKAELQELRGVRFLIRRVAIEFWAWKRAFREIRKHDRP